MTASSLSEGDNEDDVDGRSAASVPVFNTTVKKIGKEDNTLTGKHAQEGDYPLQRKM